MYCTVVSQKSAHGQSTLHVCQRVGPDGTQQSERCCVTVNMYVYSCASQTPCEELLHGGCSDHSSKL